MILATTTDVTSLPEIASLVCTGRMTGYDEKDPAASGEGGSQADPQPANEALPDGQFQDQEMPTTDGEPADPDPLPSAPGQPEEKPAEGEKPPTNDSEGTTKPGGLGKDGTVPDAEDGVAAGHTGTASTFEPEEDELAP